MTPRQPSDPDRRNDSRRESDRLERMHDENVKSLTGLERTLALLSQRFDQLDERFDKLEKKMEGQSQSGVDLVLLRGRVEVLEDNQKESVRFRWGIITALTVLVFQTLASKVHWGN
jgi:hypothetical protein